MWCRSAGLSDTPEHQLRSKSVPVDLVLHGVSENEDGMPTVTRNGSASPKVRCNKVSTYTSRRSDICSFFLLFIIFLIVVGLDFGTLAVHFRTLGIEKERCINETFFLAFYIF